MTPERYTIAAGESVERFPNRMRDTFRQRGPITQHFFEGNTDQVDDLTLVGVIPLATRAGEFIAN